MRKIIFCLTFLLTFNFLFAQNELASLNTILIIVDEEENNSFVTETTPFTDGIFKALWEKEHIFFDMSLEDPIKIISGIPEVKPYIGAAIGSGADSIFLIKISYASKKEGAGLRLNAKELYYNVYSLTTMKSLKSGRKKLDINQHIDNADQKNAFLKNTGFEVLNDIYQ